MTAPASWNALEGALLPRLEEFGIRRLADTTGLDRLGTPTASATRPGTSDVIWVYSGKGRTSAQARVTAVMECLERTGSLWSAGVPVVIETARCLGRSHAVWGPDRFTYRRRPGVAADDPQAWVEATSLLGSDRVMIPADLCFNGRRPRSVVRSPFLLGTSTGLAAAFCREAALLHGLLEVIERDIVSFIEIRASHQGYRFLSAVVNRLGLSDSVLARYADDVDLAETVDPHSLPWDAHSILSRYRKAGLDVVVKVLPNEFHLPAFGVCAVEHAGATRHLGCAGYAVRLDAECAVEAALLELAQTRATDLQGAREDRHEPEKQRLDVLPANHWLATPGRAAAAFRREHIEGGLPAVLDRCRAAGLTEVAYVQFPGWPGISVIRVVVPDAETWHATGGWSTLGPRLRSTIDGT